MDDEAAKAIGVQLVARYAEVRSGPMRDDPICNEALGVDAIGFRAFGSMAIGVVITPWFMNLIVVGGARETAPPSPGGTLRVALPAGDAAFICGELDGIGPVYSCSLFSPMFGFVDMETARATAQAAMAALFDPTLMKEGAPARSAELDRRAVLRGAIKPGGEARP
jgi:[NiFe] hydrogenase assembly HybE family chaperone